MVKQEASNRPTDAGSLAFSFMEQVEPTDEMVRVAERVAGVRARIVAAARRSGRTPDAVRLVAVTKTIGPERVVQALAAGVTDLGENYVQEARAKIPEVAALSDRPATWHLIGHLQRNKAKYCADLFSLIQSVDNYQLAQELGKQAAKQGKTQRILIEVNLAEQPERAGVSPGETLGLADQIAGVANVELRGLMGMAPFGDDPEQARPCFVLLRELWRKLPPEHRRTLSMGMSGDYEVAIEEGATLVRIGTALFGKRMGTRQQTQTQAERPKEQPERGG